MSAFRASLGLDFFLLHYGAFVGTFGDVRVWTLFGSDKSKISFGSYVTWFGIKVCLIGWVNMSVRE